MSARAFEGGCLCGQVRYRVVGAPKTPGYCHCRMCQRATGAPVGAWVKFPTSSVRFTGEMKAYESSPGTHRCFCPNCGSPLATLHADSELMAVAIPTLDEPERVPPKTHDWCSSQLPWLWIEDGLEHRER
jgi:hypothetical protein